MSELDELLAEGEDLMSSGKKSSNPGQSLEDVRIDEINIAATRLNTNQTPLASSPIKPNAINMKSKIVEESSSFDIIDLDRDAIEDQTEDVDQFISKYEQILGQDERKKSSTMKS